MNMRVRVVVVVRRRNDRERAIAMRCLQWIGVWLLGDTVCNWRRGSVLL